MGSIAHSTFSNQTLQSPHSASVLSTLVTPLSDDLQGSKPYVVVIFGRTGVGVSSLVNLILGYHVSDAHPNANTKRPKSYFSLHASVTLPSADTALSLYEVSGFCGQPASDERLLETIRDIDRKQGVDLVVYCLRKQKATVMPEVVRRVRRDVGEGAVPMLAVVTELERFEGDDMDAWWYAPIDDDGGGHTNGTWIEAACFGSGSGGAFDAHACVMTLPRKEVDLVERLRKRRDRSEEQVRSLILDRCRGRKRLGES